MKGLVLDGNHLNGPALLEAGLAGLLDHVRDLHLDGNHVHGQHGLDFLTRAVSLTRLFLAKNKLAVGIFAWNHTESRCSDDI